MNVHYADPKCQLCDEPTVGYINPAMNAGAGALGIPDRFVPRCKQHGGAMFHNVVMSQDAYDALRAQCAAWAAALTREKQHSLVLQFALMLAADCTCCVNEPSGFCEMPGCECPCCQSIVEAEERIARAAALSQKEGSSC